MSVYLSVVEFVEDAEVGDEPVDSVRPVAGARSTLQRDVVAVESELTYKGNCFDIERTEEVVEVDTERGVVVEELVKIVVVAAVVFVQVPVNVAVVVDVVGLFVVVVEVVRFAAVKQDCKAGKGYGMN